MTTADTTGATLDPAVFPLGFDSGGPSTSTRQLILSDPEFNKACTILRLLYDEDLHNLQTNVNESISIMQSYTAQPKAGTKNISFDSKLIFADTRLGRVGK